MITLYRKKDCRFCDEIEETFRDIVIAFNLGNVNELSEAQQENLPLIIDGDKIVFGKSNLQNYIKETKQLMIEWQKFQSDSCYLDDKGKVC